MLRWCWRPPLNRRWRSAAKQYSLWIVLLLLLSTAQAIGPPPPPPLPSARDTACSKVTNRWLLTPASFSGSAVVDSVGSWNGIVYGGYSTSSGALVLDGSTGYVDLANGGRTFGGAMSWAFWARVDTWQNYELFFDWGSGTAGDNLMAGIYSSSAGNIYASVWQGCCNGQSGADGALTVADYGNAALRSVSPAGYVSTVVLDASGSLPPGRPLGVADGGALLTLVSSTLTDAYAVRRIAASPPPSPPRPPPPTQG